MIDDLTFFHRATKRICGSLEISKVIQRCFSFLKEYIPLDGIFLATYDAEIESIRILALKSDIPTNAWAAPIAMPEEAQAMIEKPDQAIFRNHCSDFHPIGSAIARSLDLPPVSSVAVPLRADDEKLGVLVVYAEGANRYSDEDARLMTLLHDPFAIALANTLKHREVQRLKDLLTDDNRYLMKELQKSNHDQVVGARYGLRGVMEMVETVAPLNSPVLLLGETGVGKEVIAHAIHKSSGRSHSPLVQVNCGAIPESLLDSELFGHEKGAFTGAVQKKRGRFERAHGGTLFLDEVGELSAAAQVRLLRVLQDKLIERVGGSQPVKIDVRIITATNRDLASLIQEGQFREDLWFRLNVFPITIPPLRRRKQDIPALVNHFIHRKTQEFNFQRHPVLAHGALQKLQEYHWPGNVRELENLVERALIRYQASRSSQPLDFTVLSSECLNQAGALMDRKIEARPGTLDQAMREHIESVLELTGGKVQGADGAAAILGLNHSTLRSRMRKLGIAFGRNPG